MNDAHYHLIVNHLPIIFPMVGVIVLICSWIFNSPILRRMAYGILILGAISVIPVMETGEGAEKVVENLPGMNENYIQIHEENAEVFALLGYILGGLAAVGLFLNWKSVPFERIFSIMVFIFTFVVLYYAKETGTSGGEIRHTEIRAGSVQIQTQPLNLTDDD
ncbi:MAG: hypothetical protein Q4G27_06175 [Flavobacteriaceae bacterium]|nr:hypothetical protein [Flavobacteriaceae bacterium]